MGYPVLRLLTTLCTCCQPLPRWTAKGALPVSILQMFFITVHCYQVFSPTTQRPSPYSRGRSPRLALNAAWFRCFTMRYGLYARCTRPCRGSGFYIIGSEHFVSSMHSRTATGWNGISCKVPIAIRCSGGRTLSRRTRGHKIFNVKIQGLPISPKFRFPRQV
jgi:hypothetical protein